MATVLIVDDDSNNRLLLATLLEYAGHTVLEAANGYQGLALAQERSPDIMVIDLSLPDLPGTQLLAKLRGDDRTYRATIALYTATVSGAAIQELVETYDIRGIIPKPGDPREILAAFERLTRSAI